MMSISHVGLTLPDVKRAEEFYMMFFEMEVYVREVRTPTGWRAADPAIGWQEAHELQIDLGMTVLRNGKFALAIEGSGDQSPQLPGHIALVVGLPFFEAIQQRAGGLNLPILYSESNRIVFIDPFKVCWELTPGDYLLSSREMGYGWVDAGGGIHDGPRAKRGGT